MIILPRNWLRVILAFRMRPQSNEPSSRNTRISPLIALTRTLANIADVECMDQRIIFSGAGAFACTDKLSRRARRKMETYVS
jgi:hypothetical protein